MAEREKSSSPSVIRGGTSEAMVLRTSVSALTAFDPLSYAGCHRRWWFTRVGDVKEEETVAQGIGKECHAQAEHYEKTGEEVFGPVIRAGRKYLLTGPDVVVEAQFGNLEEAIELRKKGASVSEIEKVAGLCANGIPLDGYIDFRHARGQYIDSEGVLRQEDPRHGKVVEVGDHKTTSSIEAFAKSSVEMASTIQMVGYANYVLNIDPTVNHVRLSHIYYQTRGALLSKKVTALVSAEAARKGWDRVHRVAAKMEEVAKASRVEDVEPNQASCKAYRGCPHVSRCPITRTFTTGGRSMSLFNKPTNGTSTNGSAPPAASSGSLFGQVKKVSAASPEYDAAKAAEKAKLAEADKSYGTCMCGAALTGANISKLTSGEIKHIGCPRAGVTPADAPKVTPAAAAQPMTAEQISKIEDPEIRQRATDHAALHAQQASQQPAEKTGGRCPKAGERVLMNEKQKMSRFMNCPGCGKEYKKVKDEQIDIQENGVYWIIPAHNLPKVEAAPAAAPPAAASPAAAPAAPAAAPAAPAAASPAEAPAAPAAASPAAAAVPVAAPVVQAGITALEDYYLPLVRDLEQANGAADIRCAPNESALSFGKWKGALSAYVRSNPPPAGIYIARSNDEVALEVINTLRPMCSVGGIMLFVDVAVEREGAVVRGVR